MKIEEHCNGHGDVYWYSIEEIDAHEWSERKLKAVIAFMEAIKGDTSW